MFNFVENVEKKDIPLVRAIINGILSALTFGLLVGFVYFMSFSWIFVFISIFGITTSVFISINEDKALIKEGDYKLNLSTKLSTIVNFLSFWVFILYLSSIDLSTFAHCVILISFVLSVIAVISATIMLPNLMNTLKRINKINSDFNDSASMENTELMENAFNEKKEVDRQTIKVYLLILLPNLISFICTWWFFYYIIVALNTPIEFKVYVAFTIIFSLVLSEITKKLRKKII